MRLGIQSVPVGQMEAALSLGMSRYLAVRRIILPQAIRTVIPATANDFIALYKDTAVCSVIAVEEILKAVFGRSEKHGALFADGPDRQPALSGDELPPVAAGRLARAAPQAGDGVMTAGGREAC